MPHKKKRNERRKGIYISYFLESRKEIYYSYFLHMFIINLKQTLYFIYLVKSNCCFLEKIA